MKNLSFALATGLTFTAAVVLGACGTDEPPPTTPSGQCAPTNPECPALAIDSDCLALTDNSGKDEYMMRFSQLSVTSPEALTGPAVYKIVADGVNINLPTCDLNGLGTFSWLAEFKPKEGKVRTGGGVPVADPENGYCFDYDASKNIAPIEIGATFGADGSFETDIIPSITVPIYLDLEQSGAVYLPLREVRFFDAKISADNNCIGSFNADGLQPVNLCKPDPSSGIEYYLNGSKLEGYIELEEADNVVVDVIGQTLCVLLSGDASKYGEKVDGQPTKCLRDSDTGKIVLEGDWCSENNSAGGCKDSFQLKGQLAASAVKPRDNCSNDPGTGGAGGAGTGGAGGAGTGGAGGAGTGGAGGAGGS